MATGVTLGKIMLGRKMAMYEGELWYLFKNQKNWTNKCGQPLSCTGDDIIIILLLIVLCSFSF